MPPEPCLRLCSGEDGAISESKGQALIVDSFGYRLHRKSKVVREVHQAEK